MNGKPYSRLICAKRVIKTRQSMPVTPARSFLDFTTWRVKVLLGDFTSVPRNRQCQSRQIRAGTRPSRLHPHTDLVKNFVVATTGI